MQSQSDYMDVGIRELKARLSEYIDRAAGGETVRITDRGRPRAVLMPLPQQERLDQGLAEGWLRREVDERPRPVEPVEAPPGRSTDEILDDDRGA